MNEQNNNGGNANITSSIWKKLPFVVRVKIIFAGAGFFLLLILILSLFISTSNKSVGSIANNFLKDVDESEFSEEQIAFKKKVDDAMEKASSSKKSKTKALLMATVMYSKSSDGLMNKNGSDEEISDEDIDDVEEINNDKFNVSKRELITLIKHIEEGDEAYRKYLISTYIPKNFKTKDDAEKEKIADEIFSLANYYKYLFFDDEEDDESINGCDPFADLKVNVKGINGQILDSVPFEDYVLGVFYGEIAKRDIEEPEYGKAFYIAIGTFALNRGGYKKGDSSFSIKSSTDDQVWCDIYKGCYRAASDRSWLHPGRGTELGPMSESELNTVKKLYSEVAGLMRVNSDGSLVSTQYRSDYGSRAENIASQNYAYYTLRKKQGYNYEQILDYYYDGTNQPYGDTSSCTASGTWDAWKQDDSKWSGVPLGNSNVGTIGCLVTSIAKQIANSGAKTNVSGEFNPGTFVQALTKKGLIASSGGLMSFDFGDIAPNFKYAGDKSLCGMSRKKKAETAKKLLDKGYYIVMEVKGNHNTCGGSGQQGQHWVPVVGVNGSNIVMSDSYGINDTRTDVWEKYGDNASRIVYFEKK